MKRIDQMHNAKILGHFNITSGILWYDENNNIYIIAQGNLDTHGAEELYSVYLEVLSLTEGVLNVLVDINKGGMVNGHARNLCKKMSSNQRIGKVALFGMNPVAMAIASFFVGRTKRDNYRFFANEKDAFYWLKE